MEKFTVNPVVKERIEDYVVNNKHGFTPLKNIYFHKHLYENLIPITFKDLELNEVKLLPDDKGIIWNPDFTFRSLLNIDGDEVIRYERDFSVIGHLSFKVNNNNPIEKVPVSYELTIMVDYLNGVHDKTIEYWTKEQKVINLYRYLIEDQHKKLGFQSQLNNPQTDFGKFTEIWGVVSNNKQGHTSSYYYHYELVTSSDFLMFLVSNVNLYKQYTSNYLGKKQFDGKRYDVNLNMYDWYYLNYCSLSIENLYSYWEKIGFLLFQFYRPTKVSDNNLSFHNLISGLKKEINDGKYSNLLSSMNFKWLSEFTETNHKDLQKFRHPLIHYKIENPLFKGGLYSGTVSFWTQNIFNRKKIEELQRTNDGFVDFINHQFSLCNDGLVKTLQLINEIE